MRFQQQVKQSQEQPIHPITEAMCYQVSWMLCLTIGLRGSHQVGGSQRKLAQGISTVVTFRQTYQGNQQG